MKSLDLVREMAEKAARELDGRHGDPSIRANWIRERRLALIVITLIDRLQNMAGPVEVE